MKRWLLIQTLAIKLAALWLIFGLKHPIWGTVLFFAAGGIVVVHLFQPRWQGLFDIVSQIKSRGKVVCLTIDDGPCPEDTPRILDLLDRYEAKAVFFMIGQRAEAYPDLVRQVVARGHELGTHTYTHPLADFWCAGYRRTRDEVESGLKVLEAAGAKVRWYRSPAGIKNFWLRRVLTQFNLRGMAWSIRSGDALGRCTDSVVERVFKELKPGAIILMHEGPTVSPQVRVHAIERVLRGLRERGYRCVLPD